MAKYKVELTGVNTNNLIVLSLEENKALFLEMQRGSKEAKERLLV